MQVERGGHVEWRPGEYKVDFLAAGAGSHFPPGRKRPRPRLTAPAGADRQD